MNIVLWIIAGLLAFAFLAAGAMKLLQPRAKLVSSGMAYAEDLSDGAVKGIGALEVLAGLGLVLPALLDVAEILVPIAAVGVVLLMLGAAATHLRRKEGQMVPINLVLLAIAAFIAIERFGPEKFN